MKKRIHSFWKNNRSLFIFISLMLVFRSAFADWNTVPTGSMKPTILEGDRILVNRMAYDLRVPFTHISLYKIADPARGDIIIFDSAVTEDKMVKRVIGVPGDVVEMRNNELIINGKRLSYADLSSTAGAADKTEDLLGLEHMIRVSHLGSQVSSFSPVEVPEGYYLALGDNRDNSSDSRMIGFIPRKEIVGRSRSVVMSFNYDNYYIPRPDRFFKSI